MTYQPIPPPKELVREYQTPECVKIREVGPIVYGYSMTIGPGGKPRVREFGNVTSFGSTSGRGEIKPQITSEREPLVDVRSTDNEVKLVLEMPGVKKEDIKVNVSEGIIKVTSNDPKRKYHKAIEVPHEADIETARSTYSNGILEAIFKKKRETKPKGKEVKVE
jgi:HSP20 family protein